MKKNKVIYCGEEEVLKRMESPLKSAVVTSTTEQPAPEGKPKKITVGLSASPTKHFATCLLNPLNLSLFFR